MQLTAKKIDLQNQKTDCAVVFVYGKTLSPSAKVLDQHSSGSLTSLLKEGDMGEKTGDLSWLAIAPSSQAYARALAVNMGAGKQKSAAVSVKDLKTALQKMSAALLKSQAKDISIYLDDLTVADTEDAEQAIGHEIALALDTAAYQYRTTKPSAKKNSKLKKALIDSGNRAFKKGLASGAAVAEGVNVARELGNLPGNVCTPSFLADQAKKMGGKDAQLSVQTLSESQMKKLGMGSLLSVSAGSAEEAKLIVIKYQGAAAKRAPHVLVGKGITFDTGGISLKPGSAMDEMKFDMCGAASVFGVMAAISKMKAKVNVIGVVAAAENMPGSKASKPGDVVTSMSGQTIEILNTDAEGRLVLCDALTYVERFKPASVIDIATLTGACVVALGKHATGLFSNDQKLADSLIQAGEQTLDRAWQLPLWDDYQKSLDSNFADMANIGGREGGSITAACFLSRFTKKYRWAHLDIAGSAWHSGAAKGATGRPVALLLNYLLSH